MNRSLKPSMRFPPRRHKLAVNLLEILGIDNIRLEQLSPQEYRYFAWRRSQKANGDGPYVINDRLEQMDSKV